jgi:hypothetical protein
VTRTLVYHRHHPPKDLAFPDGVDGVIRGTPGSTGAWGVHVLSDGCVCDRLTIPVHIHQITPKKGYLDAAARMAAQGKGHLLCASSNDEEDIQALLRHEIQVHTRSCVPGSRSP